MAIVMGVMIVLMVAGFCGFGMHHGMHEGMRGGHDGESMEEPAKTDKEAEKPSVPEILESGEIDGAAGK